MATKFEILKYQYNDLFRKATWELLGKQVISHNTRFYAKDMLYYVDLPGESELHGSLIFCIQDCMEKLDWMNAELSDYQSGFITFGNDIISPNLRLVCTKQEFDSVAPGAEVSPDFVPFKEEFRKTGIVQISDDDYSTCLKVIGYPFITDDELEFTKEEILNYAIKPSLEEYFHWVPNVKITTHGISTEAIEIQFPTDAYDVVGLSVQQGGAGTGGATNSLLRYFELANYGMMPNASGMTGNYVGGGIPKTSTFSVENLLNTRVMNQALTNYNTRYHFDKFTKPDGTKWIRVYSNKPGNYDIHWAMKSLNFNDVEYAQRQNVIKYCQAEVMELFANLRQQAKSDVTGHFDYGTWLSTAKSMKEEVRNEWKDLVKASFIMRGSL